MYYFLKVILVFIYFTSRLYGIEKNDWEKDALKDKVKEFTENNFAVEYINNQTNIVLIRKILKKYNKKGRNIENQEYRYDDRFDKYLDQLNYKENRLEVVKYSFEGTVLKRSNTRIVITNKENPLFYIKEVYQYNKKGNLIEWANYKMDNSLISRYQYQYDKKGRLVGDMFYGTDNKQKWKALYKYNKWDYIIEKTIYKFGKIFSRYYFEYDVHGNMVKEKHFELSDESDSLVLSWINEYQYIYWRYGEE